MVEINKIKVYLNRNLLGKIIKFSDGMIKKNDTLSINYFY